jgi:hypothetical protein
LLQLIGEPEDIKTARGDQAPRVQITHTRITFKSNDRFGGFEAAFKQAEQPEGIKTV